MKKKFFLMVVVLLFASVVFADTTPAGVNQKQEGTQGVSSTAQDMNQQQPKYQSETLLSGNMEYGAFGAPVIKFSQVGKNFGVWVGGEGGWILNHYMWIGGAGYGLATNVNTTADDNTYSIYLGYGGGEIGMMIMPEKLVHFTANVLIGAGGASHSVIVENGKTEEAPSDTFLILEPQISMVVNVLENFRLTLGVGYLYSYGLNEMNFNDTDIKGVTGNIGFEFGRF